MEKSRYQLRKAAGAYWLLDMEQSGAHSAEQATLNESGAFIWEQYAHFKSDVAVAEALSREFGISVEESLTDVRQFLEQLREQGLDL